jgi:hypothetical protein
MGWAFAVLMVLHALIHTMGFVKAFNFVELPKQQQTISRPLGVVWLAAAVLLLGAVVALRVWPRWWWAVGGVALIVSQVAIATSWSDAKFGTIANLSLLLGIVYGFLTRGPASFAAQFDRDVALGIASGSDTRIVTEVDLAHLPQPLQRYLRVTRVVGQPRVSNYRVRFRGRIRSGLGAPWMPFEARQQSFVQPPARLFLMRATMRGLPVEAFHRLLEGAARMRVRVLGAFTLVDASGAIMNRSETVTLFNDMCILAPGSLLEPSIRWEPIDARSARAQFTNGSNTITATLEFDADGLLSNFVSEDRSRLSADGRSYTHQRFSTPVRGYRNYGAHRLASYGEAHYHPEEGEFAYGEFEMLDVQFNVGAPF